MLRDPSIPEQPDLGGPFDTGTLVSILITSRLNKARRG